MLQSHTVLVCSVVGNEAGAGLVIAQRGAKATLTECRFMSNAHGGIVAAAGASVTANICQIGDNDAGPGILVNGVGTLAKLESSVFMANGLSAVVLNDAAAAEMTKCKVSLSEAHGIEVGTGRLALCMMPETNRMGIVEACVPCGAALCCNTSCASLRQS